jgi:Icc-related predicted phosphoesterase
MKCLLVSDLHYALPQFDWTAEMAPRFDVVVIAGDHIDISGHVDGRTQTLVILKYLRRLATQVRLIVSSGNHDLDARDADGEKITRWIHKLRPAGVTVDGDSLAVGDALFTVCPWWDGENARRVIGEQLSRDADKGQRPWIWVYHAPPADSPTSWTGERHAGDADLVHWIGRYRPDIVLTGHIHESPFARGGSWVDRIGPTWVFNSGRQIGPMPAHVIFDTDRRAALWISLAGAEMLCLDEPLTRPVAELTALPDWLRF